MEACTVAHNLTLCLMVLTQHYNRAYSLLQNFIFSHDVRDKQLSPIKTHENKDPQNTGPLIWRN